MWPGAGIQNITTYSDVPRFRNMDEKMDELKKEADKGSQRESFADVYRRLIEERKELHRSCPYCDPPYCPHCGRILGPPMPYYRYWC